MSWQGDLPLEAVLRGLLIGFIISAPIGPVALLSIRRTLRNKAILGFATGVGASLADTACAGIGLYGLTWIVTGMRTYSGPLHIAGGVILGAIAIAIACDKGQVGEGHDKAGPRRFFRLLRAGFDGLALAATNPANVLGILAVVATLSHLENTGQALWTLMGVFVGAVMWWAGLSSFMAFMRHRFSAQVVAGMNMTTAAILAIVAVWYLYSGLLPLLERHLIPR